LESEGIMDYSLLVGVHFRDDIPGSKVGLSTLTTSGKLVLLEVHAFAKC
jgi:1-phosphatidylinositol-4-phosphate 5-kinase